MNMNIQNSEKRKLMSTLKNARGKVFEKKIYLKEREERCQINFTLLNWIWSGCMCVFANLLLCTGCDKKRCGKRNGTKSWRNGIISTLPYRA